MVVPFLPRSTPASATGAPLVLDLRGQLPSEAESCGPTPFRLENTNPHYYSSIGVP